MRRLYCLTYAGGNASFFKGIKKKIERMGQEPGADPGQPLRVEVVPVEYSGRGSRVKEPEYRDFQELTLDMAARINAFEAEADVPSDEVFLFGYSMGSIAAFEIVKQRLLDRKPAGLFVAAHLPPHIFRIEKKYDLMDDDVLGEALQEFGGVDERLLKNKRFFHIYADTIRSDYRILRPYTCKAPSQDIPDIPFLVFYSDKDTPKEEMRDWSLWTCAETDFCKMDGMHFFLHAHEQEMAQIICEKMSRWSD